MIKKKLLFIDKIYGWRKIRKKNTLWIKGIIYNYNDLEIFNRFSSIKSSRINKFLNTIDGHFAIIFEDKEKIISIVDQLASIPIFYYYNKNEFLISPFASKLKNKFKKHIIKEQILSLSMSSYTTGINTIYRNLYSIKAGTYIIFSKKSKLIKKDIFYEYKNWEIDNHTSYKNKNNYQN